VEEAEQRFKLLVDSTTPNHPEPSAKEDDSGSGSDSGDGGKEGEAEAQAQAEEAATAGSKAALLREPAGVVSGEEADEAKSSHRDAQDGNMDGADDDGSVGRASEDYGAAQDDSKAEDGEGSPHAGDKDGDTTTAAEQEASPSDTLVGTEEAPETITISSSLREGEIAALIASTSSSRNLLAAAEEEATVAAAEAIAEAKDESVDASSEHGAMTTTPASTGKVDDDENDMASGSDSAGGKQQDFVPASDTVAELAAVKATEQAVKQVGVFTTHVQRATPTNHEKKEGVGWHMVWCSCLRCGLLMHVLFSVCCSLPPAVEERRLHVPSPESPTPACSS